MLYLGDELKALKHIISVMRMKKGLYYDIVSLYPTVNALDPYAVGYGNYRKITPDDIINDNFFGIVICDVMPLKIYLYQFYQTIAKENYYFI